MKNKVNKMVDVMQRVFTLRHIETGEYICLRQDGNEYLACFTDGDTPLQFRDELGLLEHVDVVTMKIGDAPFEYYWLDGEMIGRSVLCNDQAARR